MKEIWLEDEYYNKQKFFIPDNLARNLNEGEFIQFLTRESCNKIEPFTEEFYKIKEIANYCDTSFPEDNQVIVNYLQVAQTDYVWYFCRGIDSGKRFNFGYNKVKDKQHSLHVGDVIHINKIQTNSELKNSSIFYSENWKVEAGNRYCAPPAVYNIEEFENIKAENTSAMLLTEEDSGDTSKGHLLDKPINDPYISATRTETIKSVNLKEEKHMNMKKIFGDMIGKYTTNDIKYSPKGLAFITGNDTYVVYDVDTLAATDVADLVMDVPIYALPVSIKDLNKGDTVIYNATYYLVRAVTDTHIAAINVVKGTLENLIPKTSIFGFSFYTKLITPMDMATTKANPSNPFGTMLPFLLMSNEDNDESMKDILMMSMMSGGTINSSLLPLMMMGKDKDGDNDLLMMIMLMGNNPFSAPPAAVEWKDVPTNVPLNYDVSVEIKE